VQRYNIYSAVASFSSKKAPIFDSNWCVLTFGLLQGRYEGGIREVCFGYLPSQKPFKHYSFQRFREVSAYFAIISTYLAITATYLKISGYY
jgi:hypothetical protein